MSGFGSRRSVGFLEGFQTGGSGCDPRYRWPGMWRHWSGIGRRVPVDRVEFVVEQYRARYWDLTVKHFPEALQGGARLCA